MSNKPATYEAINHIFYSNNAPDGIITIGHNPGQTLIIDGQVAAPQAAGVNESIQFNSLGDLAGDSTFLYDTITNTQTCPNIETGLLEAHVNSNDLNYSLIYQGPYQTFPQQNIVSTKTGATQNFGADIEIAQNSDYFASACPNYILGASTGAVSVWSTPDTSTSWSEYSTALTYTNFTLEANLNSCSINQDATRISFSNNDGQGRIFVYSRSFVSWTYLTDSAVNSLISKITNIVGDTDTLRYMCSLTFNGMLEIYDFSDGSIGYITDLYDYGSAPTKANLAMSNSIIFSTFNTQLRTFIFNGIDYVPTYTSTAGSNYLCCDVNWDRDSSTYFGCVGNASGLDIIENGSLKTNISGNFTACSCARGTYGLVVLAYDNGLGLIRIFLKVGTVWVEQAGTYSIASLIKMTSNSDFLVCSLVGSNRAVAFKIETYSNNPVLIDYIKLQEIDNCMHIGSTFGTIYDGPGPLLCNTQLLNADGSVSAPSNTFSSSPNTGFYWTDSPNQINASVNGVKKLEISTSHVHALDTLRLINGTALLPSLICDGDTTTGLYRPAANQLAMSVSTNKTFQFEAGLTSSLTTFQVPYGSEVAPSLAFGSSTDGGVIYYNHDQFIGFGCSNGGSGINTLLTLDGTHCVSSVPFRSLVNGAYNDPVFGFVNDFTSGMYLKTPGTIGISGTNVEAATFDQYGLNTNLITGITSTTSQFALEAQPSIKVGGNYKLKCAAQASNIADVSIGNNCNQSSANANGTVLKVQNDGVNRWGIEQIVTGGATRFTTFYNASIVGYIETSAGGVNYFSASDYRLKNNIVQLDPQTELNKINSLRPVSYNWNIDDSPCTGFIAHELQEHYPMAVRGEKDGADLQAIEKEQLIESLVASVQALTREVEKIKAELKTFV